MSHPIPQAALTQALVVLGKTRSGKSSTLRVLVEDLLDKKKPVCIIDPKGDWWGIKSSANGKKAGYDVVIFGGTHADVPINALSGKVVAELVATGNRPCLIDLGGWMVSDRTKFFIDFASTLFLRTRGHRWLVVDECHNFAPQGKVLDPKAGMSLHWANRIASEGAGKGIVLFSASQRPQKVHKDYLTSHETLIAKRVIHKLDRDADKDWIDACGDPEKGKEVLATLAGMKREEGWVYSPEIGFGPKLVKFPMFKTYDSFAVQTGKAGRKLKGWASVDLDEVKEKLVTVVEEAKANDPAELRAQLAEKTRELARLQAAPPPIAVAVPTVDKAAIAAAEKRGFEQAKKKLAAQSDRRVKVAVVKAIGIQLKHAAEGSTKLRKELENVQKNLELPVALTFVPSAPAAAPLHVAAPRVVPARAKAPAPQVVSGDGAPTNPQLELLRAVAFWKSMGQPEPSRAQVAAIAGWKPTGSNIKDRGSELVKLGYLEYPRQGYFRLTPAGDAIAPEPRNTTLVDGLRNVLTQPQQKIFDYLLEHREPQARPTVAEALGWEPNGSNIKDRCSELVSMDILEYPERGTVALKAWVG